MVVLEFPMEHSLLIGLPVMHIISISACFLLWNIYHGDLDISTVFSVGKPSSNFQHFLENVEVMTDFWEGFSIERSVTFRFMIYRVAGFWTDCMHVWFFATPWTVACQGFSRQEHWGGGLPCPPTGDLSDSGIKPVSLTSPALAGRFLYHFSLTDYLGFKSWFCHILSWWPWTNQFPSASLYTFLKWV